jgi:prefoldin alpha subunit
MADEEELQRLSYELQVQQSNGEAIRQQIQSMQANIMEIGSAIEAVKNLKKMKGDTLIPLGSGTFISCPKPNPEKVVISIGANLMVQKSPEEAVRILEERQKKISDAMGAAQQDLGRVIQAIEALTQKASALAAEENRNVRASKE